MEGSAAPVAHTAAEDSVAGRMEVVAEVAARVRAAAPMEEVEVAVRAPAAAVQAEAPVVAAATAKRRSWSTAGNIEFRKDGVDKLPNQTDLVIQPLQLGLKVVNLLGCFRCRLCQFMESQRQS